MKKIYLFLVLITTSFLAQAQVKIGENPTTVDGSTVLELESNTKGFLPPRMLQVDMNAIPNPATGLIVYCLDCDPKGLYQYDGSTWVAVGKDATPQSVSINCNANGFVGTFAASTDYAGRSFSLTLTNNSFATLTINFAAGDLVLSGISGMTVGTPTGSPALSSGNATLNAGQSVVVTYPITGAPAETGILTGTWTKVSLTCSKNVTVAANPFPTLTAPYAAYNHCNSANPTAVVEVTSPTGRVWMDRNLGANRAATSATDTQAYGTLFQWGRQADGHQCVNRYAGDGVTNSTTQTSLATADHVSAPNFITTSASPNDWRSDNNNNRWNATPIVNNPCPTGFRLPYASEFNAEVLVNGGVSLAQSFASVLKLTGGGYRSNAGVVTNVGTNGLYWTSTVSGLSSTVVVTGTGGSIQNAFRATGGSVRCIKDTPAPTVTTISCGSPTNAGVLTHNVAASGVSSTVSYTGGNGSPYNTQAVASTGVTGLTATLSGGTLATGAGTLTFTITGTPASSGTANFAFTIGGQSCALARTVNANPYPANYVHCNVNNITPVVNVTSGTGKVWMDRNLGATRVATSLTDTQAYGSAFQWGRAADGHQCFNRYTGDGVTNSPTTSTLAATDQPNDNKFILTTNDWRSNANNDRWNATVIVNNPCPTGYTVPTQAELTAERTLFPTQNRNGAFNSVLKLPASGQRDRSNGSGFDVGLSVYLWTRTGPSGSAISLVADSSTANIGSITRGRGLPVRCIKL